MGMPSTESLQARWADIAPTRGWPRAILALNTWPTHASCFRAPCSYALRASPRGLASEQASQVCLHAAVLQRIKKPYSSSRITSTTRVACHFLIAVASRRFAFRVAPYTSRTKRCSHTCDSYCEMCGDVFQL